jgi:tetratricopeptide (TPR) repeat protein
MTNLAVSERSAGRAHEAAERLELAYENLNQLLGPAGPETLACRLSRAVNLLALGEYESADAELAEVERRYRDELGERHPHTVSCVSNRAVVARAAGDPGVGRQLARQAADAFEAVLGDEHPYTLAARMNEAIFAAEWGAVPQAYELLEPVAERTDRVLGPEHPDAARCYANLVLVRRDIMGRAPDEEQEALRRLTSSLGTAHPAVEALRERRFLHRTLDPHPY